MMEQLVLPIFKARKPSKPKRPTWDDVQKKRAHVESFKPYTKSCHDGCMWTESAYTAAGAKICYLFKKPIAHGMCPATHELRWSDEP